MRLVWGSYPEYDQVISTRRGDQYIAIYCRQLSYDFLNPAPCGGLDNEEVTFDVITSDY